MAHISEGAHTHVHMCVRTIEGNVAPERTKERNVVSTTSLPTCAGVYLHFPLHR